MKHLATEENKLNGKSIKYNRNLSMNKYKSQKSSLTANEICGTNLEQNHNLHLPRKSDIQFNRLPTNNFQIEESKSNVKKIVSKDIQEAYPINKTEQNINQNINEKKKIIYSKNDIKVTEYCSKEIYPSNNERDTKLLNISKILKKDDLNIIDDKIFLDKNDINLNELKNISDETQKWRHFGFLMAKSYDKLKMDFQKLKEKYIYT